MFILWLNSDLWSKPLWMYLSDRGFTSMHDILELISAIGQKEKKNQAIKMGSGKFTKLIKLFEFKEIVKVLKA